MSKFETEIPQPAGIPYEDFADFMLAYYSTSVYTGVYRLDKNGPNDRYVMYWEISVAPAPDEPTVLADYATWKGQAGNGDNDRKIDKARAYARDYFHTAFENTIGPRVKAAIPSSPSNAEVAAAIRAEIDAWIQKIEDLP